MASLYLQYRPQLVKDLDLKTVRDFFERILAAGKVSHAYLFTGPRGGGKTSAARILAKILNCQKNEAVMRGTPRKAQPSAGTRGKRKKFEEPCNTCVACKSITSGSMVDLIEIDAASNRGIDDIRSLREKIRLAPVSAMRKVYIIDEVHMLTLEAFNALLKTLEEPPAHAVFVLATTEAHKVPETIVSRCVRLAFPRATKPEVRRSLDRVVHGEKLKAEGEALDLLAGGVDGSFREAVKILEQLSLSGKKITLEKVEEELGRSEGLSGEKLLNFLVKYETKAALQEIERLETLGVNWQVVVAQMIEMVRQQLLVVLGVEPQEKAVAVLAPLDENTLLHLADTLLGAARRMRTSEIAQLPLEMMLVRWGEGKLKVKSEKLKVIHSTGRATVNLDRIGSGQASQNSKELEILGGQQDSPRVEEGIEIVVPERVKQEMIRQLPDQSTSRGGTKVTVALGDVTARWGEVLVAVRPHNHSVEGLLRSTRPAEVNGDTLIVEVFYQFHLDQLKQERFMQIVEAALKEVFPGRLRLQYRLGERTQRPVRQVFDREAPSVMSSGSNDQTESAQDVPPVRQVFDSEVAQTRGARRDVQPVRQAQDVSPGKEAVLENISAEVMDEDVVKVAEEVFGAD